MIYVYIGLVATLLLLLLLLSSQSTTKRRNNKKNKLKKEVNLSSLFDNSKSASQILSTVNRLTDKQTKISGNIENIIKRNAIVNNISLSKAKKEMDRHIVISVIFSFFVFVGALWMFKVWYLAFIITFAAIYLYWHNITSKLKKEISKIENSFPEIIQNFYDEYIVHKNAKNALVCIVTKTNQKATKMIFEKLIREVYSGEAWEESIDNMANALDFFYAYAFAEILKLTISDIGDITQEIQELIDLMQDDIEKREQTKSNLHENKMMFLIINAITAVVIILNMAFHPFAKEIYSYTTAGSTLLSLWIIQIIAGIFFIEVTENT